MDADFYSSCLADDSGTGNVLWRTGTFKKCTWDHYAQLCCNGDHQCFMGNCGLQHVFREEF